MKKCLLSILIFLSSLNVYSQQDHNEIIERFLSERKKMMEEIMKAFDDDAFFKDDSFNDETLFDSFKFKGFRGRGENVKIEEVMEKDGTISIFITPLNKNQKLDINTGSDRITIKTETITSEKNEDKSGTKTSMFSSSFSRTIPIPEGYKALSPVKDGERIKISLSPSKKNPLKPNKDGRIPVPKPDGGQTI